MNEYTISFKAGQSIAAAAAANQTIKADSYEFEDSFVNFYEDEETKASFAIENVFSITKAS